MATWDTLFNYKYQAVAKFLLCLPDVSCVWRWQSLNGFTCERTKTIPVSLTKIPTLHRIAAGRNFEPRWRYGVGSGFVIVGSGMFLSGVWVGFLTTLRVGVGFFVRFPKSNWIIFLIAPSDWEFLLKLYNFFWNFCWSRDFLLYTTIYIDFNSQTPFFCVKESEWGVGSRESESEILEWSETELGVGIGNLGKVGVVVGVGYFTFDSATLVVTEGTLLEHVCQSVGCHGRHSRRPGLGRCRRSIGERRNWLHPLGYIVVSPSRDFVLHPQLSTVSNLAR